MSKQKYLVHDLAFCFDCNNCFMACKDEHVGNDWQPYTAPQPRHGHRWVRLLRTVRGQAPRIDVGYLALMCQHCENCKMVEAGFATRREDGIVLIDQAKAKGHREILDMCPYGGIYWNDEIDAPQKCTMCAHIIDSDVEPFIPRCVHSCPTEALKYYVVEPEEMAKIVEEEGLEVFHPEYNTNPHVFYKNLYRYTKNFITGAIVDKASDDCKEGAQVTLTGEGVNETQTTDYFGEFKFDKLDPGTYTISVAGADDVTVTIKESQNIGEIFVD